MTHDPDQNITTKPIPEISPEEFKAALFGGWQDISTAPKDGTPLLLCCVTWEHTRLLGKPVPIKVGGWGLVGERWHIFGASWEPTHWMPLPKPPSI